MSTNTEKMKKTIIFDSKKKPISPVTSSQTVYLGNSVKLLSDVINESGKLINNDDTVVVLADINQSISGTKTFLNPIIIPDGTESNHTVSKSQLDEKADDNVVVKLSGIQSISGSKTFKDNTYIGTNEEGKNANLYVSGDIFQQGENYVTHAEEIHTKNDKILLRNGAEQGLQIEEYAGFSINKYDGENTGYLVYDKNGIARVGKINSLQPLATREENPTDQGIAIWNFTENRFKTEDRETSPIENSNNLITSGGVYEVIETKQDKSLFFPLLIDGNDWILQDNGTYKKSEILIDVNANDHIFVTLDTSSNDTLSSITEIWEERIKIYNFDVDNGILNMYAVSVPQRNLNFYITVIRG